jgi:DNA-binding NarL/FixJ family response regulator
VTEALRVLVADDHPLFLDGLVATLGLAPGVEVVGKAQDGPSAARLAVELVPDVALLDMAMPGGGLVAAREITESTPATRVVILTASEDEDDLLGAMKAGARGYVLKGVSGGELVRILFSVHAGEVYVAPGLAWGLLHELTKPRPVGRFDELTAREREVLELVAAGQSNGEIGGQLGIAEKTVKHHMTSILSKLQVASRVEAATLVARFNGGRKGRA